MQSVIGTEIRCTFAHSPIAFANLVSLARDLRPTAIGAGTHIGTICTFIRGTPHSVAGQALRPRTPGWNFNVYIIITLSGTYISWIRTFDLFTSVDAPCTFSSAIPDTFGVGHVPVGADIDGYIRTFVPLTWLYAYPLRTQPIAVCITGAPIAAVVRLLYVTLFTSSRIATLLGGHTGAGVTAIGHLGEGAVFAAWGCRITDHGTTITIANLIVGT